MGRRRLTGTILALLPIGYPVRIDARCADGFLHGHFCMGQAEGHFLNIPPKARLFPITTFGFIPKSSKKATPFKCSRSKGTPHFRNVYKRYTDLKNHKANQRTKP
jgi:hypothetical protein